MLSTPIATMAGSRSLGDNDNRLRMAPNMEFHPRAKGGLCEWSHPLRTVNMSPSRFQEGWSIAVDPPQSVRYNFLDPILRRAKGHGIENG